ncbi:hypothetical protein D9M68_612490 [compost metagenome]
MQRQILLVDWLCGNSAAHIPKVIFNKVVVHKFGLPTLCSRRHYLRPAAAFFIKDILQHIVFIHKIANVIPHFGSICYIIVHCFLQAVTHCIINIGNRSLTTHINL